MARKRLDSSESSGLSSISSESEDDFASYSDLSSDESVTSFDEDLFENKTSTRQIDSDAESVGYLEARLALDLIDFDDFHVVRYSHFSLLLIVAGCRSNDTYALLFTHYREKTPEDRLTPVPNHCFDWLDSDDGEDSDFKETESADLVDHITLAERLARKRKTDSTTDIGKFERKVISVLSLFFMLRLFLTAPYKLN